MLRAIEIAIKNGFDLSQFLPKKHKKAKLLYILDVDDEIRCYFNEVICGISINIYKLIFGTNFMRWLVFGNTCDECHEDDLLPEDCAECQTGRMPRAEIYLQQMIRFSTNSDIERVKEFINNIVNIEYGEE